MWTVTTAFSNVTTLSDIRLDIWLSTLHESALLLKKSDNINKVSAQPISLWYLHLSSSNIWCAEIKVLMYTSLHDTTLLLYIIIFGLMLRFRSVSITKPKYYCLKIIYLLYSSMSSYFGPSWKACKGSKWSLSARHLKRLLQLRIFHLMLNLLFYSFYEFTFGDLEIVPKINVLTRLVLHW